MIGSATHALDLQELGEDTRDGAQIGNALRYCRRDTQEFHSSLHGALGISLKVIADAWETFRSAT